jgi:hypothetical protein
LPHQSPFAHARKVPADLAEVERLLDASALEGNLEPHKWTRVHRAGPTRKTRYGWAIPVHTMLPKVHGWINSANRDLYRVRP